jgi:tRNA (guanine-N7-)-methyltransferase
MYRIRSFVQRSGRITPAQQQALEQQWDHYGLQLDTGLLKLQQVFGNSHPVILEIGFGMGDSLISMASDMPEHNFLGIEVHRPGVGRILHQAAVAGLENIRVFCDDAVEVLHQCISNHSLTGVQLFFPDPWHKKKHHKRRLVQAPFVQDIRAKLILGGNFHMATDWQPYAEHMLEIMEAAEGFVNSQGTGKYAPQPNFRPITKFQRRGENKGHSVWDLIYYRHE